MEQEPAQELIDGQRHQALFIFVSRVAPAEGDDAVGKSDEPMIGDGHPMGVLAEIAERMLRAAERAFGVNDPWGAKQRAKPCCESLRILKRGESSAEAEFALCVEFSEAVHEFTAKHLFENTDRQEELLLRVDPSRLIW